MTFQTQQYYLKEQEKSCKQNRGYSMIKGSAELILFDKDNKEILRTRDNNIVTDAVQNIISGALDRMIGTLHNSSATTDNTDLVKLFALNENIVKDFFGGIMLFGDVLVSEKTHCIPSASELKSLLGYSSVHQLPIEGSTTKGTYNETESQFADGTAKLVFDFDAGVATGTIKAIALSSALGGKYGLVNNTVAGDILPTVLVSLYPSKIFAPTTIHTFAQPHAPMVQVANVYTVMYYNNGYMYYIYSNKLYKISAKSAFERGVKLFDSFDNGKLDGNTAVLMPTTGSYAKTIPSFSLNEIWGYQTSSTKTSLVLKKISGDGVEEDVTIPLGSLNTSLEEYLGKTFTANPFNTYAPGCMIKDNKIYFMVGDVNYSDQSARPTKLRLYELDFSGNIRYNDCSSEAVLKLFAGKAVGSTTALFDISTRFINICGTLFVFYSGVATGNKCIGLAVDTETCTLLDKITFAMGNNTALTSYGTKLDSLPTLGEPWISMYNGGASSKKTAFTTELFMCYLGTIDNLSEPIVKSETNSLRVIYTLTEV